MRAKFLLTVGAAACGMLLLAPANAQQKKQQTATKVSNQVQERLRVRLPANPVQAKFQTTLDKRRFVAQQLDRPEQQIGLRQPINMYPGAGEIIAPGKAHVTVNGMVSIDPSERLFRVQRNGSLYLKLVPHTSGRNTPYLVTAVLKVSRQTRMSTRTTTGSRLVVGAESLRPGEHSLNFVVQKFNDETYLQLFADNAWDLERVEITPVIGG